MFTSQPNSCDRIECISIPALTDNIVDTLAQENFIVVLDIDPNLYPNIELQNTEGVVNIRDIDSKSLPHVHSVYMHTQGHWKRSGSSTNLLYISIQLHFL